MKAVRAMAHRKTYKKLPPVTPHPLQMLWTLVSMAGILTTALLLTDMFAERPVKTSTAFLGKLYADVSPEIIYVPANLRVKEVLVENGDRVRKGQTLALLDTDYLARRLAQITKEQGSLSTHKDCLSQLDGKTGHGLSTPFDGVSDILSRSRCEMVARQISLAVDELLSDLQRTERDMKAIESFIASAARRAKTEKKVTPDSAKHVLALSLKKSALIKQRDRLILNLERALSDVIEQRDILLSETHLELATMESNIQRLRLLMQEPRISAPISGRVIKARQLSGHLLEVEKTEFVSIQPEATSDFVVNFRLDKSEHRELRVGETLVMETVGLSKTLRDLKANVSSISTDFQGHILVKAILTQQAVETIDQSPHSRQIRANDSAVSVRVTLAPISLEHLVASVLRSMFSV